MCQDQSVVKSHTPKSMASLVHKVGCQCNRFYWLNPNICGCFAILEEVRESCAVEPFDVQ